MWKSEGVVRRFKTAYIYIYIMCFFQYYAEGDAFNTGLVSLIHETPLEGSLFIRITYYT